jgi:hypothetical protein
MDTNNRHERRIEKLEPKKIQESKIYVSMDLKSVVTGSFHLFIMQDDASSQMEPQPHVFDLLLTFVRPTSTTSLPVLKHRKNIPGILIIDLFSQLFTHGETFPSIVHQRHSG